MEINLTVFNQDGAEVVDSREVAQIVGKDHAMLLRDIRGYIKYLTESNFAVSEFFIESTYTDSTGRTLPCYLCTKKGCDMIANKLTGRKGVLFTAHYVSAFEKMKGFIEQGAALASSIPFPELVQSVDIIAQSLRVNDASKIGMFHRLYESLHLPTDFLPAYEYNGNRQLKSATVLLQEHNLPLKTPSFNKLMLEHGFLEERTRPSSKSGTKKFKALTEAGLKFGENAISPHNQHEVQPNYYEDAFDELFGLLQ